MTTYYITKYALANNGKPDVRPDGDLSRDGLYVRFSGEWTSFRIGRDVFTDLAEAETNIREKRDKKLSSLRKQIERLEKIK